MEFGPNFETKLPFPPALCYGCSAEPEGSGEQDFVT